MELVILAAGAADRQAKEGRPDRRDVLVKSILPGPRRLERADRSDVVLRPRDEKAGPDDPVRVVARQGVTGHLLHEEMVKGNVRIESPNDVIPIRPEPGANAVAFEAVAFSEPDQIEPVASP